MVPDVLGMDTMLPTFGTTALALLAVLVLLFLLLSGPLCLKNDPKGFPPGPRPWPLIGNIHQLDLNSLYKSFMKLSETYGPVFSVSMGLSRVVVIVGFDAVRDALVHQAEVFAGRPKVPIFEFLDMHDGLVMSVGKAWRDRRRFSIRTLKSFGMGKHSIGDRIVEETEFLVQHIAQTEGNYFTNIVIFFIFTVISAYPATLDMDDGIKEQFYSDLDDTLTAIPRSDKVILLGNFNARVGRDHSIWSGTIGKDGLHFQESGKADSSFCEKSLHISVINLFQAGTETTSTLLQWALYLMVKHPDIQTRVHEEIDNAVGPSRRLTYADRNVMPFTNAVVHEVLRFSSFVPTNLMHSTTSDTTFQGYFLPKGTYVIPMLHSVLKDPSQWEAPFEFNPNHFLDTSGKFCKREAALPFSAGLRACLGENLAIMESFIFFACLLRTFSFQAPAEGPLPDLTPQPGFVLHPKHCMLRAIRRAQSTCS
uniref:Cytochrome P450 2K1-like n=1 Tax=Petromyzon marinus TaxID=7757 RepID=A0AAJ7TH31_PETMA|nr:cytochrome P450 2K1-like [Petromyzon marinus]